MNGRAIGWAVSGLVLSTGVTMAAVVSLSGDETRRRLADSVGLVRGRAVQTAAELVERVSETALDVREQWTETALEVRDRWTTTAEEVRARVEDTAEDWRDQSRENIERALLQAAQARDRSLDPFEDADEDPDEVAAAADDASSTGDAASPTEPREDARG